MMVMMTTNMSDEDARTTAEDKSEYFQVRFVLRAIPAASRHPAAKMTPPAMTSGLGGAEGRRCRDFGFVTMLGPRLQCPAGVRGRSMR